MKDIENIIFGCCLISNECFLKLSEIGNIFIKYKKYYDSIIEIHENTMMDGYIMSGIFQRNKLDYSLPQKILSDIDQEYNNFDIYLKEYIKHYSDTNTKILFDKYRNKEITLEELQKGVEKNVLIKSVESKSCNVCDIINDPNFDRQDEFLDIGIRYFDIGFSREAVVVIAARPGVGKTTLIRNWNIKAGIKKIPICIYELEESKIKYSKQILCTIAQVNYRLYSAGLLNENEKQRIEDAKRFFDERIVIVKGADDRIGDIDAMLLDMKNQVKKNGIKMFFIDYVQLIKCKHGRQRNEQLTYITRELKLFASSNRTPVIELAQLNREIENRTNQEPRLADLKDSGSIEQDADIVMFLSDVKIPGKYTSRIKHSIEKNRNGATGFYFSDFEKSTGFIKEIEVN